MILPFTASSAMAIATGMAAGAIPTSNPSLLLSTAISAASTSSNATGVGIGAPADLGHDHDHDHTGNWSSLIGIATAIGGNVLISFALNMQKYAHMRLRKDHGGAGARAGDQEQERVAEERAWANRMAVGEEYRDDEESTEATGLLGLDGETDEEGVLGRGQQDNRRGSSAKERAKELGRTAGREGRKSYLRSPYWWAGIVMMVMGEAGNFLAYGFAPASIVSPLGVVALISNCIIAPFMLKEPFRRRDGLGVVVAVAGAVTVVLSAKSNNPKLGPEDIWDLISTWEFETYLGISLGLIVFLMVVSRKYGQKNIFIDLGLVGLLGGYTALSTKGVASMLSYTVFHALTFPITYLLIFVLLSSAILQIKYVNRALQRFDSTQVIPTQFVLFTLSVILGSAILYRDFERTSAEQAGKFVGGCAMTFMGVWLITTGRPPHHDADIAPETHAAINLVDGERYRDEVEDGSVEGTRSRRLPAADQHGVQEPYTDEPSDSQPHSAGLSVAPTPAITLTPQTGTSPLTANPWLDSTSTSATASPPKHPPLSLDKPPPPPPHNLTSIHSAPELIPTLSSTEGGAPNDHASLPRPTTPARGASDMALHIAHPHQPATPTSTTPRTRLERAGIVPPGSAGQHPHHQHPPRSRGGTPGTTVAATPKRDGEPQHHSNHQQRRGSLMQTPLLATPLSGSLQAVARGLGDLRAVRSSGGVVGRGLRYGSISEGAEEGEGEGAGEGAGAAAEGGSAGAPADAAAAGGGTRTRSASLVFGGWLGGLGGRGGGGGGGRTGGPGPAVAGGAVVEGGDLAAGAERGEGSG